MTRARDLADYISTGVSDTELDVLDGVTAGTVTASKALVVDANKDVASLRNITATGTITGDVTGNVSGSSGSTTGNAATATALATARNIGGVSFDGTANINLAGVNTAGNQDTSGNAATATTAGTVTTAAQPNITSLGTLTTLTVDDITINGSTISDGGDFTIDSGGNITLDADGGDIFLKDNGTSIGHFEINNSGFWDFYSDVADADIRFRGNDGGSSVTALTLDMSDAGSATFNHDIKLGDNGKAIFGAGEDLEIYHDASNSYIRDGGTGSLLIQGSDLILEDPDGNNYVYCSDGGAVYLYNNGQNKLETTSTGVTVIGSGSFSSSIAVGQTSFSGGSVVADFHTSGSGVGTQLAFANDHNTDKFFVGLAGNTTGNAFLYQQKNANIEFYTNNSLRATLDNNGNLLVGKSAAGFANVGTELAQSGFAFFTRDGGAPVQINRKSSDGDIIELYKDGTEVGSIGTGSGTVYFANSTTGGIRLGTTSGSTLVLPCNETGATEDAVHDLGYSSARWRDLYLSGDAYVGNKIYHDGDTDTYIEFQTNYIQHYTGGIQAFYIDATGAYVTNGSLKEDYDALSGTTPDCNVNSGGGFSLTTSGNTTFTFTSPYSGYASGFVLQVTAGGTHTLTWPNTVDWAGGTAPDAPASGASNLYVFYTSDGGSNWIGVLAAAAYA